jgi:hypothetical protein
MYQKAALQLVRHWNERASSLLSSIEEQTKNTPSNMVNDPVIAAMFKEASVLLDCALKLETSMKEVSESGMLEAP